MPESPVEPYTSPWADGTTDRGTEPPDSGRSGQGGRLEPGLPDVLPFELGPFGEEVAGPLPWNCPPGEFWPLGGIWLPGGLCPNDGFGPLPGTAAWPFCEPDQSDAGNPIPSEPALSPSWAAVDCASCLDLPPRCCAELN